MGMKNPNDLKWSDLKTGIFFLLGLAFAAYLGLVIGKNSSFFSGVTTVKVLSNNMEGLAENNFVAVSGKKVGTVSNLDFVQQGDSLLVVAELRLRNEFAPLVTKDSRAVIKSLGVLGDKYVDITSGQGAPVEEGDFIILEKQDGLGGLASSAGDALNKINVLLDRINNGKGVAGRLIGDETMGNELAATVASLKKTSADLSAVASKASNGDGMMARLLNDRELADNTEQAIGRLNSAAARADSLIARLNSSEGTLGRLSSDPRLYDNLNSTIESLDSLIIDLQENPKRYVRFSVF